jgi:hypothetical protein
LGELYVLHKEKQAIGKKVFPKKFPGSLNIFNKNTTYDTVNSMGEGSMENSLPLNQNIRFHIPGKRHLNIHRRVCGLKLGIQVNPQSLSAIAVHPVYCRTVSFTNRRHIISVYSITALWNCLSIIRTEFHDVWDIKCDWESKGYVRKTKA